MDQQYLASVGTALLALGFVGWCLWTRHVPLRFAAPIARDERPLAYWTLLGVLAALGIGVLALNH